MTVLQREEENFLPIDILPEKMHAITRTRYGGADTIAFEELPLPKIGEKDVLVRVRAAGVDRGVWHLMTGKPFLVRMAGFGMFRPKEPVLGMDLSGVIAAVGNGVSRFAVGDEVMGIGTGAYAEYAKAEEAKLVLKPAGLDFARAAVVPISGGTAIQAVLDKGNLREGQSVLIIGASGGVGSFAVQIAKAHGGKVTGVASGSKGAFIESLGADRVIDYSRGNYLDGRETYDLIIDTGGLNPLKNLRTALKPGGTLVIVGGEGGGGFAGGVGRQIIASMKNGRSEENLIALMSKEDFSHIDRVKELIANKLLVPPLEKTFVLEDASRAIDYLTQGRVSGKIALIMD